MFLWAFWVIFSPFGRALDDSAPKGTEASFTLYRIRIDIWRFQLILSHDDIFMYYISSHKENLMSWPCKSGSV